MSKHIAVYLRVSSRQQQFRSQRPELERWISNNLTEGEEVRWYTDKASGATMARPGWTDVEAALQKGEVSRLVVWRIDRLGRTASGLTRLFEELTAKGVGFVSITEGLDLAQPAGRLIANIMASVAAFERELRTERQLAGIDAAKAAGKTWGGSEKGRSLKVTPEIRRQVRRMAQDGESKASIARVCNLTRPTVYAILGDC